MRNRRKISITKTCFTCKEEYVCDVCPKCKSGSATYEVQANDCSNCYRFAADGMSYPSGKCGDGWTHIGHTCDRFIPRITMKEAEHLACMIEIFGLDNLEF
jgi:hypothetical protein